MVKNEYNKIEINYFKILFFILLIYLIINNYYYFIISIIIYLNLLNKLN